MAIADFWLTSHQLWRVRLAGARPPPFSLLRYHHVQSCSVPGTLLLRGQIHSLHFISTLFILYSVPCTFLELGHALSVQVFYSFCFLMYFTKKPRKFITWSRGEGGGACFSLFVNTSLGCSHRVDRVLAFSPVVGIETPPLARPQASVSVPLIPGWG